MKKTKETITKIFPYDGYVGEPFWNQPDSTTYDDYVLDTKFKVPIISIEELRQELGMSIENKPEETRKTIVKKK